MIQTHLIFALSLFPTLSLLSLISTLITYIQTQRLRRAHIAWLQDLDLSVGILLHRALGIDDDREPAPRHARTNIFQRAPSPTRTDNDTDTDEQTEDLDEARLAAINEQRAVPWPTPTPPPVTTGPIWTPGMSFNEWMTALGQFIVPSRRLIYAPDNPGTRIEPPRTVDRMQRNGMFGIPIASLLNSQGLADFNQARRVYEEDTDSMRVNPSTWTPRSPFADGGLSSTATNWSGTTLVGSEEASLSGETLIREVSSNSETVPLVRR
jgi:hypothetical protein